MSDFQHSLVLDASPETIFAALTTPAGLRGWWTQDCDIATAVGGTSHFRFGPNHKDMRIERLEPGREVRWRCTRAHIAVSGLARRDEWVGTTLTFHIAPEDDGRTRLDFVHAGLVPALECYDLCSRGWRHFLASFERYVHTGCGSPHAFAATTGCSARHENAAEAA